MKKKCRRDGGRLFLQVETEAAFLAVNKIHIADGSVKSCSALKLIKEAAHIGFKNIDHARLGQSGWAHLWNVVPSKSESENGGCFS